MPSLATIRQVTVRYQSEGAEKMRADADAVAAAQDRMGRAVTQAATSTTQAAERTAVVTETASRRQLSALSALDRERARVDQNYRQQQQLDRSTNILDRAASQGLIDTSERERLLNLARTRYAGNDNRPGANGGLSSYDKMFIRYQGFDVASSLGSGASPLTVAFQQGPQVLQHLADREGGLREGLGQLAVSARGLITPFSLAAVATAATAGAFALAAKQASDDRAVLERATQGLGRGTGATVSDLDALAKTNAAAGKVSTSTAREIVAGYASVGTIALPVIGDLTRLTERYARLAGTDAATATTDLARAFSDLGSGMDQIASKIGGLDDRTAELIRRQLEMADKTAAQQTAADYLKSTIDANAASTTGWAAAWDRAKAAADGYWEAAKRVAGIKLGVAPEGAQEAEARLKRDVDNVNRTRAGIGMEPLGLGDSLIRQRDTAAIIADTERRQAVARAAEERATKASRLAGDTARDLDPLNAQYRGLVTKRNELQAALDDPLARSKLDNVDQVREAAAAYGRAVDTMVDSNGRLVTSAERARQADQLRADALKATTDAEKAAVAERQKAFDLAGKPLSPLDAGGQITRAGALARLEAADKGGGRDSRDEFDRAVKSAEDRARRQQEESETFGMGAAAVARYRTETELLTAAKRAERDITPALVKQVRDYADRAAEAAGKQDALRESMRDMDLIRSTGREVFSGFGNDLMRGVGAADALTNALGRIESKLIDMAAQGLLDMLLGKTGTSNTGALGSLFGTPANSNASGGAVGAGFFASIASALGFAEGGYTGYGSRLQPAGIVHRGEVVFSQADVARWGGPHVVDRMRLGYPGYEVGGMVGLSRPLAAPTTNSNAPPSITFVTPPGMALEADGPPRRSVGGGYEQVLRSVDAGLGKRARDGRGSFAQTNGGPAFRLG